MDFTLSETQDELAALTRQIVTDQVTQERLKALERNDAHFDRTLYAALAEAGVLSAGLPDSIGGGGLDLLEQCSVLIELGREVAPVPYLQSIVLAAAAIGHFGTDAQRAQWARPAANGSIVLVPALSEELADSPDRPTTRAERAGDAWTITGAKAVVPFGTVASAFLVPAATDDGAAVFIVPAGAPGLTVTPEVYVDGDEVASLRLSRVRVDEAQRFGDFDVVHWLSVRATIGTCAHQLGVLERALELTVEYARERKQFDRPIGSFQAVAQRLADAYVDVEGMRLTMLQAAWLLDAGVPASEQAAVAKWWAAEGGHRVAHAAQHVHGGVGVDVDYPLSRYFRWSKQLELALGGSTAQLLRLGAGLAAEPV